MTNLSNIDSGFAGFLEEFSSSLISIDEIIKFNKSYLSDISFDPERLENSRNRLSSLKGLIKKYGTYENIFNRQSELEEQLNIIGNFDEDIYNLKHEINELKIKGGNIADEISAIRFSTAKKS